MENAIADEGKSKAILRQQRAFEDCFLNSERNEIPISATLKSKFESKPNISLTQGLHAIAHYLEANAIKYLKATSQLIENSLVPVSLDSITEQDWAVSPSPTTFDVIGTTVLSLKEVIRQSI